MNCLIGQSEFIFYNKTLLCIKFYYEVKSVESLYSFFIIIMNDKIITRRTLIDLNILVLFILQNCFSIINKIF